MVVELVMDSSAVLPMSMFIAISDMQLDPMSVVSRCLSDCPTI